MSIDRNLLCALVVICASINAACGKKEPPPTPEQRARTNLFKEQVKSSQRSETWDGHDCSPPTEAEHLRKPSRTFQSAGLWFTTRSERWCHAGCVHINAASSLIVFALKSD